jgi:hypothetical protein
MKLLSRLQISNGISSREARGYRKLLSNPVHHCVTVLVSKAIELNADAICFGFRPDIFEDPESQKSRLQAVQQIVDRFETEKSNDPVYQIVDQCAQTRGPDGETHIPLSMRIGGVLRHFGGHPANSYGMILNAFQCRPVALGATEKDPQPMRYIEIGYAMSKQPITSNPTGKRRFAEVDLELKTDNTFWVYIRDTREIESGVRVSQTIF